MNTKEQENQRYNELEDVRRIATTQEGKNFFKRLFAEGRLFHTTFTGNSTGFYLEGQRKLALFVFNELLAACPDELQDIIIMKGADDDGTRTK